ncbi:MAG: FAD-dependent oxidoreductase [Thermoleophilia bacterium]|nr:FAD-dependent oxidoreductase [Thermoleophilia bacterium]
MGYHRDLETYDTSCLLRSAEEVKKAMPQTPELAAGEPILALTDRYGGPEASEIREVLSQPDMAEVKAVVCWRGVALRENVCVVQLALDYLRLVQKESCGRCGPCRIGVDVLRELLEKLATGDTGEWGPEVTVSKIRDLVENIQESAWCGIANTIRDPIIALLDIGTDHFTEHAQGIACEAVETVGWVTAPCRSTCPSNVDCASYIFQALEEHPHLATAIVKRDNPLPAIIGRACPHPCETKCSLAPTGHPVAINNIKRWCADRAEGLADDHGVSGSALATGPDDLGPLAAHELTEYRTFGDMYGETALLETPHLASRRNGGRQEKVAIIGAGPAGLSAGYYLARLGYKPTIFEELGVPGGMLYVGIPEYRLPRHVIRREVELICQEGVEIFYNTRVGRDIAFAELEKMGFRAVFVAVGAHLGRPLGIPGEDLPGTMDAIEFLRKVALGEPVDIGDKVLVLGGGNSAMDAARTAVRLGAREVKVVYRRTRDEMPANPWEVEEAEEEGVEFLYLAAPLECRGDETVQALVCQQMQLGEPDESGRRRPVPTDLPPLVLEADSVIAAVGQKPDFGPFADDPDLKFNRWGYLEVDPHTLMTDKPGVFVGGDAVSGGGTIIEAISAGKRAAKYIDKYLRGEPVVEDLEDKVRRLAGLLGAQESRVPLAECVDYGKRQKMPVRPVSERIHTFEPVELGYSLEQVKAEADRCLRCHRPILLVG